ncbi:MAG: PIG-L family deacetylase [Chloroflexi bacterium]|nr:PIG-L family deacetylase [Chloroflexota bacterium]
MSEPIDEVPERVMVVAAHPDDEGGCAATIAKWVKAGTQAFFLFTTNGDKGTDDIEITSEELAVIRDGEVRAATAMLGGTETVILPNRDGELFYNYEFRGQIVRYIRKWRPDAVFTHDPTVIFSEFGVNHADHRATGLATVDAVFPFARGPWQYPEHLQEGLQPHRVNTMYFWGAGPNNNVWSDISDSLDLKIEAMSCHTSQFKDPERMGNSSRERAHKLGEEYGVQYAESFRKLTFRRP